MCVRVHVRGQAQAAAAAASSEVESLREQLRTVRSQAAEGERVLEAQVRSANEGVEMWKGRHAAAVAELDDLRTCVL